MFKENYIKMEQIILKIISNVGCERCTVCYYMVKWVFVPNKLLAIFSWIDWELVYAV